jgi:hypothetical protein
MGAGARPEQPSRYWCLPQVGGKNCTQIYLDGTGPECLAVKKGRQTFAVFFETRR